MTSVASIAIKLEALEVIALLKIIHHFADTRLTEQHLNELDTLLVKSLKKILSLNHSTTVRTCFEPKRPWSSQAVNCLHCNQNSAFSPYA